MKNLDKRKSLASKILGVGKNKIIFDNTKLSEIKEAITKQDIRDLYSAGVITIKDSPGRKKIIKRKTRRGPGKIKRKVNNRKIDYMILVRKLRRYINELKIQGKLTEDQYQSLRIKIKSKLFKDKNHIKEYLEELK